MKRCRYCLAEIPSAARKCQYCGEWVDSTTAITTEPKPSQDSSSQKKGVSRYNFGEKAFLTGLLAFCLPPMLVIALALGVAALVRQDPGDSPGLAIAGIVLAVIALLGWMAYAATMILLHSH
jgi:hypothetical protein